MYEGVLSSEFDAMNDPVVDRTWNGGSCVAAATVARLSSFHSASDPDDTSTSFPVSRRLKLLLKRF